ncbi:hypothetical protein [Glycomyces niveus]|uniref:DUF2975 domain-containing protein n=1 Tax=Glycomyces niveus TaxID=2820287 RepID=A0ABS3U3W7_9ACTN|nr:hypothetical protein [Glycomyces sp. NEAU-S30]MBO3733467.1 hypothetical protein [Glycomyces sp. NEAU-S30]
MAYPPAPQYPQSPPPGPKTKPWSVTAVVWTQILTAVLLVASGIAMFSVMSSVEDAVTEQLLSDPELADSGLTPDNIGSLMTFTFALVAGVYVVFAVFYVIMALLVNKGNRAGRILSWILSGIGLLCCGIGGLIGQVSSSMTANVNGQEYQDEATQAIEDATPAWVNAIDWATLIVLIVGSLVIIILLAVPASNEFFRKEEPPMGPYMGQPPYGQQPPPQPPQGGQPPYGQQGPEQPPYGQQPPPPPQQ